MKMARRRKPQGNLRPSEPDADDAHGRIRAPARQRSRARAEYRERWDKYLAQPERQRGPAPARDLRLEPLADILRGEMRVHMHATAKDEFLSLISSGGGVRLPDRLLPARDGDLQGRGRARPRRHRRVASIRDAFGRKIEHWDQIPQNAAFLNARGVLVALHSDFPFFAQRLYTEAAKLVRYGGISEADALKTITINAARLVGVEKRVGSLEPGKDADLAFFDRHPFDSFSLVQKTWIDGELVFDRRRDSGWLTRRESQ